jgi:hypothetical protein
MFVAASAINLHARPDITAPVLQVSLFGQGIPVLLVNPAGTPPGWRAALTADGTTAFVCDTCNPNALGFDGDPATTPSGLVSQNAGPGPYLSRTPNPALVT